jgi:hypothetical protein
LFYFVRNRFFDKTYEKPLQQPVAQLKWNDVFLYPISFYGDGTFVFLNLSHTFSEGIDWNFSSYRKLWTYNLNYFDFLNQKEISKEEGLRLIKDFIAKKVVLKDAREPYPISLRGINWIKFISKNGITDPEINQFLFNDYIRLTHNLEYHLLGNHLLENAFSLFFGAYYFQNETFYKKAKQILTEELNEQVLEDGAHFELSPMYHQIILHRLLDCVNLAQLNPWKDDEFLKFLKKKALQMLSWLHAATFSNGNIPMVNDSAYGIAPTSQQLFAYSKKLELEWEYSQLTDSGYRKFSTNRYELFVDVGRVGPSYQPGHAHADTFNFELYIDGKPIIVDTGITTYEKDELRQQQRGTAAHNTVKIGDRNQSQVWGGFRVAKRAKIVSLKENKNSLKATHDGYRDLGILHKRRFIAQDSQITIRDRLSNKTLHEHRAFLHFHPDIRSLDIDLDKNRLTLEENDIHINFKGKIFTIQKENYEFATGFNETEEAIKISISFDLELNTQIVLLSENA